MVQYDVTLVSYMPQLYSVCKHLIFIDVPDYVAWKGRFCAFDYANFERFMTYIFAQVMHQEPHISDPWDTNITIDALGKDKDDVIQ